MTGLETRFTRRLRRPRGGEQLQREKVRLASKKVTLREKERIQAVRLAAGLAAPSSPESLNEVTSFLKRFEAEPKARTKAHNDRAALRRKALAQGQRPA